MKRINDLKDKNLQKQLRSSFLKDGFIFFPSFLNTEEIDLVKRQMDGFIKANIEPGEQWVLFTMANPPRKIRRPMRLMHDD